MSAWLLLLLADGPRHGWDLRGELLSRGFEAEPSVLYRSLRAMEQEGLLASRWSDSSGGPKRRVYSLDAKGRAALHRTAAQIATARRAQNAFLKSYRSAYPTAS